MDRNATAFYNLSYNGHQILSSVALTLKGAIGNRDRYSVDGRLREAVDELERLAASMKRAVEEDR